MEELDKLIDIIEGQKGVENLNGEMLDWRIGLDNEASEEKTEELKEEKKEDIIDDKAWEEAIQPDDGTEKNEEYAPYID